MIPQNEWEIFKNCSMLLLSIAHLSSEKSKKVSSDNIKDLEFHVRWAVE